MASRTYKKEVPKAVSPQEGEFDDELDIQSVFDSADLESLQDD